MTSRPKQDLLSEDRVRVFYSSQALIQNYNTVQKIARKPMIPMIKANAYGHGDEWAARLLRTQKNLYGFGVATFWEAKKVRSFVGSQIPIFVFSEGPPWNQQKIDFCAKWGLTAIVTSIEDWRLFKRKKWSSRVSYQIQLETGMHRLGMTQDHWNEVAQDLAMGRVAPPRCIFSHMASGESVTSVLTRKQIVQYREAVFLFRSLGLGVDFHLANSATIWNQQKLGIADVTDCVRPGITLYGVQPWYEASRKGLQWVSKLETQVIAKHQLSPGDRIGYGGTFQVRGNKPIWAAILAAGYGDGVFRSWSNRGHAAISTQKVPVIGRVSMDLLAIQCNPKTRIGQKVELFGERVSIWDQARAAGTIPYELLTSLSERVRKIYV